MKKEGHPPYQEILFVDSSTGYKFVCGSTLQPKEKEMFEGKEYPVYRVPVSSASHPFFTGSKQFIDSEGRVDKFVKRYAKVAEKKEAFEAKKEEAEAKKKLAGKKGKKKTP
jgi:large subunit ribosomal protein L31